MVELHDVEIEDMQNTGCNNGQYPAFTARLADGTKISGTVCGCRRGCSNTDRLEYIDGKVYVDLGGDDNGE